MRWRSPPAIRRSRCRTPPAGYRKHRNQSGTDRYRGARRTPYSCPYRRSFGGTPRKRRAYPLKTDSRAEHTACSPLLHRWRRRFSVPPHPSNRRRAPCSLRRRPEGHTDSRRRAGGCPRRYVRAGQSGPYPRRRLHPPRKTPSRHRARCRSSRHRNTRRPDRCPKAVWAHTDPKHHRNRRRHIPNTGFHSRRSHSRTHPEERQGASRKETGRAGCVRCR